MRPPRDAVALLAWLLPTSACVESGTVDEVEALAARACACADHACAAQARRSLDELLLEKGRHRVLGGAGERIEQAAYRLEVCAMKRGVSLAPTASSAGRAAEEAGR
jgi:hypothetical protein